MKVYKNKEDAKAKIKDEVFSFKDIKNTEGIYKYVYSGTDHYLFIIKGGQEKSLLVYDEQLETIAPVLEKDCNNWSYAKTDKQINFSLF